jgi:hypothetical protein
VKPIDPGRLVIPAAAVGTGGLLLTALAFALYGIAAIRGWYFASLFFLGLSLGSIALRAVHGLTGGTWGAVLREPLRASATMLPLLPFAFLPILLLLDVIFPWRDSVTSDPLIVAKLGYMQTPFLTLRLAGCFAAFLGAAALAGVWSRAPPSPRRAVLALVLWALGLLIFATDWMVAPDPRFYSTIYPVLEAGAEMLGALATAVLLATLVLPFANPITGRERGTRLSEDLANLLFGFLLLLVYLAFMQWLVIWSGDLPEEIGWYITRTTGAWSLVLVTAAGLATIATAGFLYRPLKMSAEGLAVLAGLVLATVFLDSFWRMGAAVAGPAGWPGLASLLGIGGLWLAGCCRLLVERPTSQSRSAR